MTIKGGSIFDANTGSLLDANQQSGAHDAWLQIKMTKKIKVLSVFGTRPEAIKMAPLVRALAKEQEIESTVCVTGQHRHMLDQVLTLFDIVPDIDLQVMQKSQSLNGLFGRVLDATNNLLIDSRPDYVLVHGDTTTAAAAGIASFHLGIPVGHIEAGLRTGNLFQPYPEEANRRIVDVLSSIMFAPTKTAKKMLVQECLSGQILVTGNTIIDALSLTAERLKNDVFLSSQISQRFPYIDKQKRLVLVTGHRRESIGDGFIQICEALREISKDKDLQVVYPVHLNPQVRETVVPMLSTCPNIYLIDPLDYIEFVWMMMQSTLILTDSGGIQEEAPFLGIPVLVLREVTERPEALATGLVMLVGTSTNQIVREARRVLSQTKRKKGFSPYGDGQASKRIVDALCGRLVNEFDCITAN